MAKYKRIEDIPEQVKEKLKKYFTNVGGSTFCIHGLPSELTGGALARYSRAKTGMQLTIINEFLGEDGNPSQEKGSLLMDRVLNAYGDDSVGELEGVHVGFEDVSMVLTKEIEDRRIGGSPIEQSTRYVVYDQKDVQGNWRYMRPKEIMEVAAKEYEQVMDAAFTLYAELIPELKAYFKKQFPREEFTIEVQENGKKVKKKESELTTDAEKKAFRNGYNFTIRCAALDVGRCVLPSSTLTHIGMFANGRFYTHLLNHLKSSPLLECQERANDLKEELDKVIPTFVKRVKAFPKRHEIDVHMRRIAEDLFSTITPTDDDVTLVQRADIQDEVVASSLFSYTNISLQQILEVVKQLPEEEKKRILRTYRGDRETRRDRTGRGTEAGYPITFDLVGGYAEYRDLQRHRMLTQQRQLLSTELGFILPPEVIAVGFEKQVLDLVQEVESLHEKIRQQGLLEASQYVTLFNHRIRFMMGMNLRELQHLTELRTSPHGHHSYRAMSMEMVRKAQKRDPWMEDFLEFVNFSDPDNRIARAKEQSRISGKNLASGVDASTDLE